MASDCAGAQPSNGGMSPLGALLNEHFTKWTEALNRLSSTLGGEPIVGEGQDKVKGALKDKNMSIMGGAGDDVLGLAQASPEKVAEAEQAVGEGAEASMQSLAALGQTIQETLPIQYVDDLIVKMGELSSVVQAFQEETGLSLIGGSQEDAEEGGGGGLLGSLTGGGEGEEDPADVSQNPLVQKAKAVNAEIASDTEETNQKLQEGEEEKKKASILSMSATKDAAKGVLSELKGEHKAFAIGDVIMKTQQGIMQAMTKPFPISLVEAAKVAAKGAVSLSKVKGVFHDGINNVPETGTYLLQSGERVLDRRLNNDLKSFLKGASPDGKGQAMAYSQPSVNLTVNGDMSPDNAASWRDELEQAVRDLYRENLAGAPF